MGAMEFIQSGSGATAALAFVDAVAQAAWDHGHSGYSGTIAEKSEFVLIEPRAKGPREARDRAKELLRNEDPRIRDKWGPAGAIQYGERAWLFFGWASS